MAAKKKVVKPKKAIKSVAKKPTTKVARKPAAKKPAAKKPAAKRDAAGRLPPPLPKLTAKAKTSEELANPAAAARKRAPAAPPAEKPFVMRKPPLDEAKLGDEEGREELLDAIGAWIVDALDGAEDDEARAALAGAICAFSDVREAAGQERGEYAGHFFMVDAVGLDDTDRPVPWDVLRERVGEDRLDELTALFDEVLSEVP